MIFLIWAIWVVNIIFVVIVLLNFLIAIVSQSYEEVMASQMMSKYLHRAELIREHWLIISQFQTT